MLLNNNQVESRLHSLDNLINRLSGQKATEQAQPAEEKIEAEKEPNRFELYGIPRFSPGESSKNEVIDILPGKVKPARQDESLAVLPPSVTDLIADAEDKIKTAKLNGLARDVMDEALYNLRARMDEVAHPKDLSRIATDMSRLIANNNMHTVDVGPKTGNVIIYKPIVVNENHYEALQVAE